MILDEKKRLLKSNNQPKRIRSTIRTEAIHPTDFNHLNLPYACEDCSHFASYDKSCTLGLNSYFHLAETQKKMYALNGHMALCRFQEID